MLSADLVVAADGGFSRVRESLLLTRRVDYLDEGYTRLLIPRREGDPPTEITEYWNGSRRLLYDPCTDEQNYICLCCNVDDEPGRRVPVDKETWLESFPHLSDIIERIDEVGRWDRAMRVTCRAWSRGKAAVVGDAAHAQPPNLGQGANLTFQNALSLASLRRPCRRCSDRATAVGEQRTSPHRPCPEMDRHVRAHCQRLAGAVRQPAQ